MLRCKFASHWLIKWNEVSTLTGLIFGVGINTSGNDDSSANENNGKGTREGLLLGADT